MDSELEFESQELNCRALTHQEHAAIDQMNQRQKGRPMALFKTTKNGDSETLSLAFDESLSPKDRILLTETQIMKATGAAHSDVGIHLLINLGNSIASSKTGLSEKATKMNAISLAMQSMGPQDEYEGQLIAQLVALHEHVMDWLGRAKRTERIDFANIYLNGASKLLTRHHETLETLLKYRRKGEQRVHVEHVHVHNGGQAIVGNVSPRGRMNENFEEGPHAKV